MERKREGTFQPEGKKSVHSGTTGMPLENFWLMFGVILETIQ
jgi:hypothetical protein